MIDDKDLAASLAREHFYCPGPFNEDKFAKDYALFLILRKQALRFIKTDQINMGLALNNVVVLLNSFGRRTVNQIFELTFEQRFYRVITPILAHLGALDNLSAEKDIEVQRQLGDAPRYNLGH